jgi:hypothetical protein
MEFEEIKQVWDSQDDRPVYLINEKTLHERILLKKKQANHLTQTTEFFLILVYLCSGSFILAINFYKPPHYLSLLLLGCWILLIAFFVLLSRVQRIRGNKRFDRSIQGDLDQAISIAGYQLRLSQFMRWNMVPVAILILLGFWEGGKTVWITGCFVVFFILAYFLGGLEHKIYKGRRDELRMLKKKLEND